MKLGIDAMSGDLGSRIVVEACLSFLEKNKTDELYVVGKIEELEALKPYDQSDFDRCARSSGNDRKYFSHSS